MIAPTPLPDRPSARRRLGARLRALTDRQSLRFVIAAGANTAVGLAFFPMLVLISPYFRVHYMIALVIAQVTCLCFAFATYKLGVFRSRGRIVAEFMRFSSFYLVNYAINWVMLPVLVEIVGFKPIIAQLGFAVMLMTGSYFWHSKITFTWASPPSK